MIKALQAIRETKVIMQELHQECEQTVVSVKKNGIILDALFNKQSKNNPPN